MSAEGAHRPWDSNAVQAFLSNPCRARLVANSCFCSSVRLPWCRFGWGLLGTLLGNLAWEPVLRNLWESLRTCSWEPVGIFGNLFLGTLLGNLAWEPGLGTWLGNAFLGTWLGNAFLGTWELWQSGFWLLRPAPGPLLWLKTPSLRCWGKRSKKTTNKQSKSLLSISALPFSKLPYAATLASLVSWASWTSWMVCCDRSSAVTSPEPTCWGRWAAWTTPQSPPRRWEWRARLLRLDSQKKGCNSNSYVCFNIQYCNDSMYHNK